MRLLVAFDGSEGARAALREATTLARKTGAPVVMLRALNPLVDAADVVAATTDEAMAVVTKREQAALEAAVAESGLSAEDATCVVVESRRGEDIAEVIEREAVDRGATIIVISSRRVATVAGAMLGSVTQHVLRHAPCPVLVVRK